MVQEPVRVRSFDLQRPAPERDPEDRPRLPSEAMMRRDAQVAQLRRRGLSYRAIARVLGCSLGSVQKSVRRTREAKRRNAFDE
jgi:DNA-directed RNA polymerase specialized sigma24 family protein